MAGTDSRKVPYLLLAGAIGGAVGYLLLTESGKRKLDSLSRMRVRRTAMIPEKIDAARKFVENRGHEVSDRVRSSVDRVKDAVSAGQDAYNAAGRSYETQMEKMNRTDDEVLANLHRAVDNLGKLMRTVRQALFDPFFEVGAVVSGVDRGVRRLASGTARERVSEFRTVR
jgi:gas vesicle protein